MNNDIRQQAPDYAEPIVGVRAWLVDEDGFLSSMTMREERWMPGEEKKASCGYPGSSDRHVSVGGTDPPGTVIEGAEHIAPQRGCACGLYAFYDRRTYEEYGDGFSLRDTRVAGVVSAWGEKVILCEYGFRAQYMKLEALVLKEKMSNLLGYNLLGYPDSVREACENLAGHYGVPLLLPDQVEAFSRERGAVVERQDPYKAHALIKAIHEWRKSERLRLEHRPGSQGGEGGAPTPPEEGGAASP